MVGEKVPRGAEESKVDNCQYLGVHYPRGQFLTKKVEGAILELGVLCSQVLGEETMVTCRETD